MCVLNINFIKFHIMKCITFSYQIYTTTYIYILKKIINATLFFCPHLSWAELKDLRLFVACVMLVHSSSMAVRSCWIMAGTGTHCRIRWSRASQTCSMGDMPGEYSGHARTGMFSASRNYVQILATWGRALSCCNMRWWSWMNGTTLGLRISSRYISVHSKCHQ